MRERNAVDLDGFGRHMVPVFDRSFSGSILLSEPLIFRILILLNFKKKKQGNK